MAMNSPSTQPKPANSVQEISSRLSEIQELFGSNAERMERIVTRAFGESAKGDEKDQPRAVPNGEIGAVMERLGNLAALASHQKDIIARLDGIV